jgi:arsenate reductase
MVNDTKRRVLFLCTGNSARSQMAEAFVQHYAGDILEPHSAGLVPRGVNPLTVQVMREVGNARVRAWIEEVASAREER